MLTPEEQAELDALEAEFAPKPARAPGDLSNVQLLSPEEEEELRLLEQEFSVPINSDSEKGFITRVGETIDSYTGAPVREAIGRLQQTGSIGEAARGFVDQFGANPDFAPTGKEIAENAGFSSDSLLSFDVPVEGAHGRIITKPGTNEPMMKTEVSPAGMVGFGVDIAADLTNLLPFAGALKKVGKGGASFLKGSAKATDMALGTPLVKVADGIGDVGKASKETVRNARVALKKLFRPDVADDYNDLVEIMAKNNIDPKLANEAIEFGENSIISRHARNVAEGPLGAEALENHEKLVQAVSEAAENNIAKIGKTTSIADNVEAGGIIRQAYDEGVDNFFNQMGETFGNALKIAPDMKLDNKSTKILSGKLNEMEMWAKKRIGRSADAENILNNPASKKGQVTKATAEMLEVLGSTNQAITKTQKAQAEEVLRAVQVVKGAINRSGGDLAQVYSAMRDIGEIAFKSKNYLAETPSDIRKFQELYFSLQKGTTESIRSGLGDEFADALISNNKEMSKFFSQRSKVANIIGNKNLADENVFKSLVMNGDSGKIDALFSIISPEAASQLKATFLNNTLVRNADGVINFASSRKKLNGLKQSGKLKNLLSLEEMQQLDEVLRLGDRAGIGVLSTSGTGASNKFKDIVGTMKEKIAGDTLVENLKKGARSNYVEQTAKTADGIEYTKKIRAPESSKPKSGLQLLREKNPVTKKQTVHALRVNSNQERNDRTVDFKKKRGIK